MAKKPSKHEQELTDHLKRLQAEFDNYRKRTDAERDQLRQTLNERIIKEIIPVLDNLQLAVQHADGKDTSLLEGVKLVENQLTSVLEDHGLQAIPTDTTFDPGLHEAVETIADEKKDNNTIMKTHCAGYKLGTRILRPAKVTVVKNR